MAELTMIVSRRDLVAAAIQLRKLVKKAQLAKSELVLDFAQDSVALTLGVAKVTLPAIGCGSGRVFMSGLALDAVSMAANGLSAADVLVRIDEKMVHFGTTGVSCRWVREEPASILLPLNASLIDVLKLRYRYSQDEIAAAGLEQRLFEVEEAKAGLIARAAETLKPLGISSAALDHFVTERIREDAKRHYE